jgi:pyruvate kinase
MVENPIPTRAEVTDVFLATEQGATGVMLSAESAVGQYPELCVRTMSQIIIAAETPHETVCPASLMSR